MSTNNEKENDEPRPIAKKQKTLTSFFNLNTWSSNAETADTVGDGGEGAVNADPSVIDDITEFDDDHREETTVSKQAIRMRVSDKARSAGIDCP